MARGIAQRLGQELGQQIVIRQPRRRRRDHRSQGGCQVARRRQHTVLRHDGHTGQSGALPQAALRPAEGFRTHSLTHITARLLVVGPSVAARNIADLVTLAKSKPRGLTYGSAGNGSSSQLAGALFEALAGVGMLHVPYKGSSPLLVDVLAGRCMAFDSYTVYEERDPRRFRGARAGPSCPSGPTSSRVRGHGGIAR